MKSNPLIGICNLLIGLSVENNYYSQKKLFSRPVLSLGIVLLITFPFVWYIIDSTLVSENLKFFLGPGFALILTSLCTSYSIAQAEKKVKNK